MGTDPRSPHPAGVLLGLLSLVFLVTVAARIAWEIAPPLLSTVAGGVVVAGEGIFSLVPGVSEVEQASEAASRGDIDAAQRHFGRAGVMGLVSVVLVCAIVTLPGILRDAWDSYQYRRHVRGSQNRQGSRS